MNLLEGNGKMMSGEKSNVAQIRSLLPRDWKKDVLFFALCAVVAALTLLEPLILSKLIEGAVSSAENFRTELIFLSCAVFLLRIGLGFCKDTWILRARTKAIQAMTEKMFADSLTGTMETHKRWAPAYLASRILDEATNLDGILNCFLIDSGISILICLGILLLMGLQNWLIALLTVLFIAVDYVVAFRLPLTKVYKGYSESLAKARSQTVDVINGITQIKLGNCYGKEQGLFSKRVSKWTEATYQKSLFSTLQRATGSMCRQFGYLILIVVSAVLIAAGRLHLGQLTLLISAYQLIWSHAVTAENIIPMYRYGKAACDRMMEVLSAEKEAGTEGRAGEEMRKIQNVQFDGVTFSYDGDSKVLDRMSFQAEQGEITCLAGESGCGKSTAFSLLLGFYGQDAGAIKVNGVGVSKGELVMLRPQIGYVGQNSFLFDRSVRDNMLYYVEDTPENLARLQKYIDLFSLREMIEQLPDGLDSFLGDNACTVSGGERQRLCLIRELMKKPDILLLDECTSQLDTAIESKVFQAIRKLLPELVVIQIAHKESALAFSDKIYVVENGRVCDRGTHDELRSRSERYRYLLQSHD
ncbi:MAG: ABC transporter ATP-binding protein [Oscillospiraceae bacterium]|nr:ABC transporter ATP-binding protein [Oscillospiraceae bacterium]